MAVARKKKTTRRTVKKSASRRRNPEIMYNRGYEHGVEDIEQDQYEPSVLGESYINLIGNMLSKQEYTPSLDRFDEYVKGYLDAGFEKGALKESDKIRANKYIAELKREPVLFTEFTKIIWMLDDIGGEATLDELVRRRNEHKSFVKFIVEGLEQLGYIEKVGKKYELTSKGLRSLPFIIHANKVSRPDQFKDIKKYLEG